MSYRVYNANISRTVILIFYLKTKYKKTNMYDNKTMRSQLIW